MTRPSRSPNSAKFGCDGTTKKRPWRDLPPGWLIVAHYYDVESGQKDLALRGRSRVHENFDIPIPRDGGIQDLLADAKNRPVGSTRSSADRARHPPGPIFGTKVEHDLGSGGVAFFAADEPISSNGKRATTILTRRVKQGVAKWYVLEIFGKP